MNRVPRNRINSLPAVIFWVCLWQIAAELFGNALLLPGPVQVLRCLFTLAKTAAFWQTTFASIGRILLGVVSATALGVILAVLCVRFRLLEILISPMMTAMQATPVASFTVLVLIWVDRDFVPVLICGMMVLPVIFNNVSAGIRLVDPQLLEITGGIVQGMSGSPILQDGKIVGAVTHVLVNDPTRGYGIFIENMLEAAG